MNLEQTNGEYKMTGPQECLVSRASATGCLPASISASFSLGLNKNHSNLVKFATHDDDFYRVQQILSQVCQLSPHSRGMPQKPEIQGQAHIAEVNSCLKELGWTNPHDDRERIKVTKGGICDNSFHWILEHRDFNGWRNDDQSRLLWIRGDAGKGKTMLLIGMSEELNRHSHSATSFFFCQNSDQNLNNSVAILKGLIYLLLLQENQLVSLLKTECDRSDIGIFEGPNAFYTLSRIFRQMIQDPSLKTKTVFLVVDALDECESGLSDFCRLISETMLQPSARIKWVVSSRNQARIDQWLATTSDKVCLDLGVNTDLVSHAIQNYINWKISHINLLQDDRNLREVIESTLHVKADGTFLWVALVVRELLEVEEKSDILAVLEDCPAGLDQIYERMLKQISEQKRNGPEMCWRILSAAVFAYRPLHLHELHVLSGLKEYNLKVADVERRVHLCRSFLTVRKDYVYLIHQSAKDFLTRESPRNIFPCTLGRAHYDLFRRSIEVMRGVLKRDLYNLCFPGITINDIIPPVPNPFRGAEYSCVHWIIHYCDFCGAGMYNAVQMIPTESDIIFQFLKRFLLNWLEALSLLNRLDDGVRSLRMLEQLLEGQEIPASRQLSALVYECRRFLLQNKWMIQNAPLQTYVSALIFSPRESEIRKIFRDEEPNWMGIKPRVAKKWGRCLQTLEGHTESVCALAFSCDSRLLASGSDDSTVRLWDLETGSELHRLTGHKGGILSVAFSYSNANLLASGSEDGTIRLWNLETGTELKKLECHKSCVTSVVFSQRNPNILASGSNDGMVRLWDLETKTELKKLESHGRLICSISFSNHGENLLASGSDDGTVRVWDIDKGSSLHLLMGHEGPIECVAFSNISKVLASASVDFTMRLWDSESGLALKRLENGSDGFSTIAFSHNSHILASGSNDYTVRLWDTETGSQLQKLEGHNSWLTSIAFHNNSKLLASASCDSTIRLWDLEPALEPEKSEDHHGEVRVVAISHDASILASGSDDGIICLWDADTGSEFCRIDTLEILIKFVALSCDSKMLAFQTCTGPPRIWDLETCLELHRLDGCDKPIAFSYNSVLLASKFSNTSIMIWDLENGRRRHTLGEGISTRSVSFSFDSRFLASELDNGAVWIWDPLKGSALRKLELHRGFPRSISFSLDSKLLGVEFYEGPLLLCNAETGAVSESFQSKRLGQALGFPKTLLAVNDDLSRISFMGHDIIWLPPDYRPLQFKD
ncbi:unnamed protein product, partial [Clonostachys rosea]